MGFLYSLGFGTSLPPMQIAQQQNDVAFTLPMDDRFVAALLRIAVGATAPANFKR
jgi:hypothetical protein